MHPVLFYVGDFPIRTFGLLLAVAALAGMWLAGRRAPSYGLTKEQVWDLCFWLLVAGVLGARALFILQEWSHYSKHPEQVFRLQFDGLTSFGGLLGGAIAAFVWSRRAGIPFATIVDVLGLPALVAHAIGRVGCLLNGCCYGHPIEGFPGVHMVDATDGHALHQPAQLYDMFMLLVGTWVLARLERRGLARGQSGALMLTIYGTSRFVYEFWRAGTSSTYWGQLPITEAQAAALVMALAGAVWYLRAGANKGSLSVV